MNAFLIHDRIEDIAWDKHYAQVCQQEREHELADWFDKSLKHNLFESLARNALAGKVEHPKAISTAFDDDCDFQEELSRFTRLMAEKIAKYHVQIEME